MIRQIILTSISLLLTLAVHAQELTIEGMQVTNDLSASQFIHLDLNKDTCGLVKVRLAETGASFEGNVIKPVEYKNGEYWVYMTKGSKELHIKHPKYVPVEVHFADFNIPRIKSSTTYKLTLLKPATGKVVTAPVTTYKANGVSFKMVMVKGGTFTMGATQEQGKDVWRDEKPAHQVTLSSYYIGQTEVTQELWQAVMGNNPAHFKNAKRPVESVEKKDINEFIKKLNQLTGRKFRLPTEAEWEFAARGGTLSKGYKYAGSDDLTAVAWYGGNSSGQATRTIASKRANELGIFDMSGNVYELCLDWYDAYKAGNQKDPVTNPPLDEDGDEDIDEFSAFFVGRGGSVSSNAEQCRVTYRRPFSQSESYDYLGLRLALSAAE